MPAKGDGREVKNSFGSIVLFGEFFDTSTTSQGDLPRVVGMQARFWQVRPRSSAGAKREGIADEVVWAL